ncbi:uncharacterized protein LOC132133669 [Carassius carassius]|uniref:uncharacterized protein LOC132133669 n=1 Tax=Carassius carassius TaxID=217509 RepID=UPI00286955AD|nr:uncharacterized protein LOC132133669 [Carassius carassius]
MSVIEMPEWVMNELNKIVHDFIWEGKGVKIAQKTLVARKQEGGLKLIDLETKKLAIRIKTVKKYMEGRWEFGWREFLKKYIDDVGRMGEYGWYMGFKQSMTVGMPDIYREVMEAWRQVKDIIYEVIPGFLRNNCIYDSVCELDGMESRVKVNNIYERIKASLPSKWVNVIEKSCVKKKQQDLPEMYIMKDGEKYNIKSISVKKVYDLFIMDQIKVPASEKVWSRVFEDLDVKKIWSNMDIKYNTIECENNDFLIRHNRIYTNVVLNKINNNNNVMCDVCNTDHETFLHYFLECNELKDFFVFLKSLLKKNCFDDVNLKERWRKIFLFGVFQKKTAIDFWFINYVLSHARLAVVLRRNYAHFEGRKVKIKDFFKAIMTRDIEMCCKYGGDDVKDFFVTGNKFIKEGERKEVLYNW